MDKLLLLSGVLYLTAVLLPGTTAKVVSYSCKKVKKSWWGRSTYRTGTCYRTQVDPVNGGWTKWAVWKNKGGCSATCEGGKQTQVRTRSCSNPAPSGGGKNCAGSKSQTRTIECGKPCPINGGWSDFSGWYDKGVCSVSCGGGTRIQERNRTCTNPAPGSGGKGCSGSATETQTVECGTDECPQEVVSAEDGWNQWSDWQNEGDCNVLCGGGNQNQKRNRTCPLDRACNGNNTEERMTRCGTEDCGDRCPETASKFLNHPSDPSRFYQCSNHIAFLHECPAGLVFLEKECGSPQGMSDSGMGDPDCTKEGELLVDPNNCHAYFICDNAQKKLMKCPAQLRFDKDKGYCDFGSC